MVEKNSLKTCLVCGSQPAKKNYGILTCSPCKVFFRRSFNLILNLKQCDNNEECQININNRTICRVCRLKKCFAVGMSQDLFRSSRATILIDKKVSTTINQYEDNCSQFNTNQQLILLNIVDSYDVCSPILNITEMMKKSLSNPSKIRLKLDKNNLMIIQGYFYSSIFSFIKINDYFNSLSKNDRRLLIKRNIHNLSGLNQLFTYNQIHFLDDPIEKSLLLDEYGLLYFNNLSKIISKVPVDRIIIKFSLIILTFSTCSDIVHFDLNQFCGEHNHLSNTLNLLNIQNIYVEILFKYLINNYGYDQAVKQFLNLTQIILEQNKFLQIGLTNQKHYQTIQTTLNQIELDYRMDYEEIMDSSL